MAEALGGAEIHTIPGANHYYIGADQYDKLKSSAAICTEWLAGQDLH